MKFLGLFIVLLFLPNKVNSFDTNTKRITIMQINAKWNRQHNVDLNGLRNCDVKFGWLEEQSPSLQKNITTVPVIVLYNGSQPVMQWTADLSFKLDIDLNEIQKTINSIR